MFDSAEVIAAFHVVQVCVLAWIAYRSEVAARAAVSNRKSLDKLNGKDGA